LDKVGEKVFRRHKADPPKWAIGSASVVAGVEFGARLHVRLHRKVEEQHGKWDGLKKKIIGNIN
jgi:hypothetical protein